MSSKRPSIQASPVRGSQPLGGSTAATGRLRPANSNTDARKDRIVFIVRSQTIRRCDRRQEIAVAPCEAAPSPIARLQASVVLHRVHALAAVGALQADQAVLRAPDALIDEAFATR